MTTNTEKIGPHDGHPLGEETETETTDRNTQLSPSTSSNPVDEKKPETQHEASAKTFKGEGQSDTDIDIEAAVPASDFDGDVDEKFEPGPNRLKRIESHSTIKSKVSRVLSIVSSRKKTKERIAYAPIPTTDLDKGIVGWDSQDDPAMPLNFSKGKKWLIVGLVSAITFVSPMSSSILAPGIGSVNADFDNGNQIVGAMTVSIFLLGMAIGPLFLAPLSEIYGRQLVLGVSNAFFCVWQIGCALAPSIASLIVFRFFTGMGAAGCIALGAGIIADVFRTHEIGLAVGVYSLGPLVGPTLGPLIGGFLSETIGWRWDFWIVFIVGVAITVLIELLNQETNHHVLIQRKVKRLRAELHRPDLKSCYEVAGAAPLTHSQILRNGLVRPTKMLFLSPIVFFLSLYMAFAYGLLYLLFTTIPVVFEQTYGFSVGLTGLVYICMGVGNFVGWGLVTANSDKIAVRLTAANGGVFEPEMRLPVTIYSAFLLPATFFWYGWATYYKTHWIVPILGLFPFACGVIGLWLPIIAYLVDAYKIYAASAVAASTVLRSLVGMLLPLAGPSMYQTLGLGWGNSLLGFICVAMIPVPIFIHRYGKQLRLAGLQL
ncbi:major facilitator superfamily domain-containing protein [Podospora appendiculata]|uniref:Major facilitator superfamily domain-containing protein n=1 Tax=Podospora appendiculata TaxID=314037 RepID=A0AAE0X003_9PEZI|nr:major facilitator superfamily domain-containing protein [Podospora appendiculata]